MNSIIESLNSEDANIRHSAISQIKDIPYEERKIIFEKLSEDINHHIRQSAAEQIYLYPEAFSIFSEDPDHRIRIQIIQKSPEIIISLKSRGDKDAFSTVINQLIPFQNDPVYEVRGALALVLVKLIEDSKNPQNIVNTYILPIYNKLLEDINDDVRIATSGCIRIIRISCGIDFMFKNMYESLTKMLKDMQWRVRINAIELMFSVALVCSPEFFDQHMFELLMQFLRDPCNKIRLFALNSLPALVLKFGDEWLKKNLVVELRKLAESHNFLDRETYLLAMSTLVSFFPVQYQSNYVFQPMIRMLKEDNVNNVILLAIELLAKHKDAIHPFRRQYELKPILEALVENKKSPPTIKEQANLLLADK